MKKILTLTLLVILLTGCSKRLVETRPIKSCNLSSMIGESADGKFVMGFASYKSEKKITTRYYLYILGDEGYRLQEIESEDLEIVETNDVEPCIKGVFMPKGIISVYEDYIAYVPIGTITQEYDATIK